MMEQREIGQVKPFWILRKLAEEGFPTRAKFPRQICDFRFTTPGTCRILSACQVSSDLFRRKGRGMNQKTIQNLKLKIAS